MDSAEAVMDCRLCNQNSLVIGCAWLAVQTAATFFCAVATRFRPVTIATLFGPGTGLTSTTVVLRGLIVTALGPFCESCSAMGANMPFQSVPFPAEGQLHTSREITRAVCGECTPPREGSLADAACVRAKAGVAVQVAVQMLTPTERLPALRTC